MSRSVIYAEVRFSRSINERINEREMKEQRKFALLRVLCYVTGGGYHAHKSTILASIMRFVSDNAKDDARGKNDG